MNAPGAHTGTPAPAPVVSSSDDQDAVAVDPERWGALARTVLVDLGIDGPAELTLTFVDEPTITALNRDHLGADRPTDVLSFPIEVPDAAAAGDVPVLLGDIVVCPAVAARNAPDHAGTLDDELALLVVHGVLHVVGHDHAEHDEAVAMRALEAELLARHHRPVAVGTEIPDAPA